MKLERNVKLNVILFLLAWMTSDKYLNHLNIDTEMWFLKIQQTWTLSDPIKEKQTYFLNLIKQENRELTNRWVS